MKRDLSIIILGAALLFAAGCKKEKTSATIEGTWELQRVVGMATINYPPGIGNLLKFDGYNYELYVNGTLIKSGTYAIIPDQTVNAATCMVIDPGRFNQRIIYDNDVNGRKEFLELAADKLSIMGGCFAIDAGYTAEYIRQ